MLSHAALVPLLYGCTFEGFKIFFFAQNGEITYVSQKHFIEQFSQEY